MIKIPANKYNISYILNIYVLLKFNIGMEIPQYENSGRYHTIFFIDSRHCKRRQLIMLEYQYYDNNKNNNNTYDNDFIKCVHCIYILNK